MIHYTFHVAGEEKATIGLVFWCHEINQFIYKVNQRYGRLSRFFPDLDPQAYKRLVTGLNHALKTLETKIVGIEGQNRDLRSRSLDSLIEGSPLVRSNVLSVGSLKGGITEDPKDWAELLYQEFVERYEKPTSDARVDHKALWIRILEDRNKSRLGRQIAPSLEKKVTLKGPDYELDFQMGWQNGVQQVAEPISFDYSKSGSIVERANTWVGRLTELVRGDEFSMTAVVHPPPGQRHRDAYERAKGILRRAPNVRILIESDKLDELWKLIARDLGQQLDGNQETLAHQTN